MLKINEQNMVEGREIHSIIESKNHNYSDWVRKAIIKADLQRDKDFLAKSLKSTGGRPEIIYEFTLDAAKEICLLEQNEKGKQLRRWLIGISEQRENLDLVTIKESAFAFKVINCLKYIDNQKEAYSLHQQHFLDKNINILNPKYIYSEFAKYRASIVGWDKAKVDNAIDDYLKYHSDYNRNKIEKLNMSTKLSIMDIGNAIRVAVLDILYSKETDKKLADKFSILCMKLANEMKVQVEKTNTINLFKEKENIETVRALKM